MRTLVIAFEYPWPVTSGSRLRLQATLRALGRLGSTDLVSVVPADRIDFAEPPGDHAPERVELVAVRRSGVVTAGVTHPLLPSDIPMRDRKKVTRAVKSIDLAPYDLVWYFDARARALVPNVGVPAILDLNDLDDQKIWARLAKEDGPTNWNALPGVWWSRLDARRWSTFYRRESARLSATVVSSALDADRAGARGVHRVEIVPNTYPIPERPLGRPAVGSPPTVLFQGTLLYPPNTDGARWLIDQVAPMLRQEVSDVRIRLVGKSSPAMASMHRPPEVTLVGPVPDMGTELSQADLVVAPIRFGSGTRLKILEAFAHRIPVVSTTLGAEGLDIESGRHLLVADSPSAFARACGELLVDSSLRCRLVDEAHAHVIDRFADRVADQRIGEIVEQRILRS